MGGTFGGALYYRVALLQRFSCNQRAANTATTPSGERPQTENQKQLHYLDEAGALLSSTTNNADGAEQPRRRQRLNRGLTPLPYTSKCTKRLQLLRIAQARVPGDSQTSVPVTTSDPAAARQEPWC